eukprot:TRINITY_DN19462_c0_g1_i1.p1 TRINITY_DN19462_c0_g1~~TRINITY_DN19462_c0_g1_i1.p1  ORF type:complete len:125 (-),score=14.19 TRINITY_DN19462_c0_g1_i1:92-466(-)
MEVEKEGSIAFPNMSICTHRTLQGRLFFSTGVYRKGTHTNRYIDSFLNHYYLQKMNTIFTLMYTAYRYCDDNHFRQEQRHIHEVLLHSGHHKTEIAEGWRRVIYMAADRDLPEKANSTEQQECF